MLHTEKNSNREWTRICANEEIETRKSRNEEEAWDVGGRLTPKINNRFIGSDTRPFAFIRG